MKKLEQQLQLTMVLIEKKYENEFQKNNTALEYEKAEKDEEIKQLKEILAKMKVESEDNINNDFIYDSLDDESDTNGDLNYDSPEDDSGK
ncbi:hypothetical protein K501DRAFT_285803 [Backusella circina FSU 941]|nr:hypothetical protein K501DRAFT_285803 [Backusella circina FSU 941]